MINQSAHASGLVAQLLSLFLYLGSEWVMYLLLMLSVVSIAVVLERAFFYRRRQHGVDTFCAQLESFLKKGDTQQALVLARNAQSLPALVALSGLETLDKGAASSEEFMSATLVSQRLNYERGLAFLGTLGNNAPFVGLFGTVLGIIRSFRDLSANTAEGSSLVMSGIAEALVATAVGLLVALPAVALFNTYQKHVKKMAQLSQSVMHLILAVAKKGH